MFLDNPGFPLMSLAAVGCLALYSSMPRTLIAGYPNKSVQQYATPFFKLNTLLVKGEKNLVKVKLFTKMHTQGGPHTPSRCYTHLLLHAGPPTEVGKAKKSEVEQKGFLTKKMSACSSIVAGIQPICERGCASINLPWSS